MGCSQSKSVPIYAWFDENFAKENGAMYIETRDGVYTIMVTHYSTDKTLYDKDYLVGYINPEMITQQISKYVFQEKFKDGYIIDGEYFPLKKPSY